MADQDRRRGESRGSDRRSEGGNRGQGGRRGDGRSNGDGRGGDPRRGGSRPKAGERGRGGESRPYSRRRDDRRDDRREPAERTADQKAFDGPEIPEDITGREIDRSLRGQLASLPEKLALRVARHLVAAGRVIESDPKTAYQHTLAARARAGRLAVVREAVGEAAYAAGEYTEALAELRAAKRMNGSHEYVAVMADCERALGRPDRALTLLQNAKRDGLSDEVSAELVIVEAGARRDRGESDAALRVLEGASLMSKSREPWVVRLRYVYADTLVDMGRVQDAIAWFHRAEAIDAAGQTDAGARAAELEKSVD